METNQAPAIIEKVTSATTLPDEATFRSGLEAIRKFQAIVKSQMIEGHDYGVIPGTQKPTLLKPGAEKITKLLGLADEYTIMEQVEDWDKPFFHYLVKSQLRHLGTGIVLSEGVGECNSYESKYRYRWVFASQIPQDTLKPNITRMIKTKKGPAKQYRFDNDDIYSQVNTILKMAKKRAMVDAALSAGRLSDVFTQDIEDMGPTVPVEHEADADGVLVEKEAGPLDSNVQALSEASKPATAPAGPVQQTVAPSSGKPKGPITPEQIARFKALVWPSKKRGWDAVKSLEDFCERYAPNGLEALSERQAEAYLNSLGG